MEHGRGSKTSGRRQKRRNNRDRTMKDRIVCEERVPTETYQPSFVESSLLSKEELVRKSASYLKMAIAGWKLIGVSLSTSSFLSPVSKQISHRLPKLFRRRHIQEHCDSNDCESETRDLREILPRRRKRKITNSDDCSYGKCTACESDPRQYL